MTRKITADDIRKAVNDAYNEYKSLDKGTLDPRLADTADADKLGITVMLVDGTTINKGDTDVKAPLGDIANLVAHTVLLDQNGPRKMLKLAGKVCPAEVRHLDLPMSPHAIRAYSAIEPRDDADGKYNIIMDMLLDMTEGNPDLDDNLYKTLVKETADSDEENKLAKAEYTVYDNISDVMDGYARLEALRVSTEQLATIGATIAADGKNPVTGNSAFDNDISAAVTTFAAYNGRTDKLRRYMMRAGAPSVFSFSGLAIALMPGIGSIAVYGPKVGKHGRSKQGKRIIQYITEAIGYNIFASSPLEVFQPVNV